MVIRFALKNSSKSTDMKSIQTLYIAVLSLISIPAISQSFTGPTEVCPANAGTGYNYSYWDDVQYSTVEWTITGGGIILSGTGLSRNIRWTADGTVTVKLKNSSGGVVSQDTKTVTTYRGGTISGYDVCAGNSTTITTSDGYTPTTYTWSTSTDGTNYTTLGNYGGTIVHTPTSNTWYSHYVTGCKPLPTASNIVQVLYKTPPVAGTLSLTSASSFCLNPGNTAVASFTSSGASPGVDQWYYQSKDGPGGSWTGWQLFDDSDVSSKTYNVQPASATVERYYEFKPLINNSPCAAVSPTPVAVTVYPLPYGGTMTAIPSSYCASGTVNLSVSGIQGTGGYFQKREQIGSSGWGSWASCTTPVAVTPSGSESRSYEFQWVSTSPGCASSGSNIISTVVYPNSSAGTLSPGVSSYCTSGTVNLSLTSFLGSLQWRVRYKDGTGGTWTGWSTFSTASSLANSYAVSSGSIERYYDFEVIATSGSCNPSYATTSVTVYQSTVSGTTGAIPASYCSSNSVSLSVSGQQGYSGYYQKREKIGSGSWGAWSACSTPVAVSASGADTRTYEFQWISTSPGCADAPASVVSTIVYPNTSIGTLATSGPLFCSAATINLSLSSSVGSLQWQYRSKDGVGGAWTTFSTFSTTSSLGNTHNINSGTGIERYYEFKVLAQSGSCAQLPGNTITNVIVYPTSAVGTLSIFPGSSFYTTSPDLSFSVSTATGTVSYESSTDGSSWPATPNPTPSINQTKMFRAKAASGICAAVNSTPVTVNIYPSPVVTINGPNAIPVGVTTNLSVQSSFTDFQWVKNNIDIPGATSSSYTVTEPADYTVKVKGNPSAPWATSLPVTIGSSLLSQPQAINYKIVTNIHKQGFTENSNFYSLLPNEVNQVVDYMDGYGRTVQQIAIGQTPGRKDAVQPYGYKDASNNQYQYLGYSASTVDGKYRPYALRNSSTGNYAGSDQHNFYQNGNLVETDAAPYAMTNLEASPLQRVTEQGGAGNDWQPGGGHSTQFIFNTNAAGATDAAVKNIRTWTLNGPSGMYADYKLAINTSTDENGNKAWSFADKLGRVILKRVQLDETVEGISTPFLETYYVYDDRGNLSLQIPPKAASLINQGASWNTSFRDQWCFVYTYDERNRLVEKKTPDAEPIYYGYDPLDRLVLMQDGYLRTENKWMFIKYDIKGRAVMTGIYQNAVYITRATLQINVLDPLYATGTWYEEKGADLHGYTNASFPTTILEVFNVNYYDNYDFDNNGTYSYVNEGLTGEGTQFRAFGLPTGSKRLVLGSATWLYKYVFYDKHGRAIQIRSNNHLSAAIDNLATYVYNSDGTLKYSKTTHKGTGGTVVTTLQRMDYDHTGRLTKLFQSLNGGSEVQVATYVYNELGQVVDKKLHSTNGVDFLQSVDYRYNIRGWLKSINNAQLNVNAANNDDANDYFGMELLYNTGETGLNDQTGDQRYWNGNISAIKWKGVGMGSGTSDQRSYKYAYDKSDKLKTATFQAYAATAWTKETGTLNEALSYDANGNIKTLQRNRNLRGLSGITITSAPEAIDNLTYTYAGGMGNRLTKVEDAIAGLTGEAGFKNGQNVTTEYTYDANGSLLADKNKGIDSVYYNVLGKVRRIKFTDGRVITYLYDAAGSKLTMKLYQGTTLQSTTDYAGSFVYENGVLGFFGSPEGRVVKKGGNYEYEYSIADHQGNTRVVFSSVSPAARQYTATFETGTQVNEQATFQNYPTGGNHSSLELFDHTDFTGSAYTYSQLLNGGNNSQVGLAKSFKVYPGDKVKIEAYAKYYNPQSTSSNLNGFAAALTSAFGLTASSTGEAALAYDGLDTYGSFVAGGGGGGTTTYPKAFVNILLFDEDHNFLDIAYEQIDGGEQVGESPKTAHDYMVREYVVKEAGYAYVYISNESATLVDVYFDDLVLTHTLTNVIQYNEYYPFGLQTDNSWTRDGNKNDFLYNAGNELNASSRWYEMFFRGYDAALGKMLQVDPMADKYGSLTPYNYAFNDPVLLNDPLGDDAIRRRGNTWTINWDEVPDGGASWKDGDGPQDASTGPDNNEMFGDSWNYYAYGSYEGAGGATSIGGFGAYYHGRWENYVSGGHYVNVTETAWVGPNSLNQGHYVSVTKKLWVNEYSKRFVAVAQQGDPLFGHDFVDPNSFNFQHKFGNFLTEAYYSETFSIAFKRGRVLDILHLDVSSIAIKVNGKGLSKESAQYKMSDAFQDARIAVYDAFERTHISSAEATDIFLRVLGNSINDNFPGIGNTIAPNTEFVFEGDVPISVIQLISPRLFPTY